MTVVAESRNPRVTYSTAASVFLRISAMQKSEKTPNSPSVMPGDRAFFFSLVKRLISVIADSSFA
jgi:hypothetical protein